MDKEKFSGRWRLVSHEFTTSDGKVFKPYGDDAIGEVMFDSSGRFSAQIMRRDRKITEHAPTTDEIKKAYLGYVAYFGRFEVDEEKRMLINHVEGALNPAWVGGVQIRYYEFNGDKIILRTDPIQRGGVTLVGKLVWKPA